jgi:hypothetical protein
MRNPTFSGLWDLLLAAGRLKKPKAMNSTKKCGNYQIFCFSCQWEKVLFADFDIQNSRILQLCEFVWDEKCFWILCLKCVVQGTEQYHCSGYRRRSNNILKRYHGDKLSLLQLCSCTGRAPSWGRWSSSSESPKSLIVARKSCPELLSSLYCSVTARTKRVVLGPNFSFFEKMWDFPLAKLCVK